MSYEILNKTSNGFDITVNDEDQAETEEIVDDDETNEELKASIDNLIFKKHITPKDRHVQKLNSELLSSIQQDDMETFVRFYINLKYLLKTEVFQKNIWVNKLINNSLWFDNSSLLTFSTSLFDLGLVCDSYSAVTFAHNFMKVMFNNFNL